MLAGDRPSEFGESEFLNGDIDAFLGVFDGVDEELFEVIAVAGNLAIGIGVVVSGVLVEVRFNLWMLGKWGGDG